MNKKNKKEGITLIALIITIIVTLILVTTTLSLAISTGLFEKAKKALNRWNVAQEAEKEASSGKIKINGVEYNTIDEYLEGFAGISPPPEGEIIFGDTDWNAGEASITISTSSKYEIEYQLNGITEKWIKIANGGTIGNLSHGTKVYARLIVGNNAGDWTSIDIKDKTKPKGEITIDDITSESIKITVNASDGESGLATSETYAYYLNSEGTAKKTSTNNTYTYENLAQNTNYTIRVVIKDQAGNEYEATTTAQTGKIVSKAEIAQNPIGYYGQEVVNYGVTYDDTEEATNKWRIFYADEENIYLIADDYIHKDYAPKAGTYEIDVNTNYRLDMVNVYKNYTGATNIDSTLGNKWLSKYYPSYKNSKNQNIRAVAYMLDTSIWNPIYKNQYAEHF